MSAARENRKRRRPEGKRPFDIEEAMPRRGGALSQGGALRVGRRGIHFGVRDPRRLHHFHPHAYLAKSNAACYKDRRGSTVLLLMLDSNFPRPARIAVQTFFQLVYRSYIVVVVYSYRRLSTREQLEGDGLRRQDEGAVKWVARHPGYVLDDTLNLTDKRRSGFHGHNLRGKGALLRFLTLIGTVIKPGSILLIESLDRLSRRKIDEARETIDAILKAGIIIVTLMPEDEFTAKGLNDIAQRVKLDVFCSRAHEESAMRSARSKANWQMKREAIKKRKPVTATRPFWLDIMQHGQIVGPGRGKVEWDQPVEFVPNEKAKILRHTFDLADPMGSNFGAARIAQELHLRGWRIGRKSPATHETIIRILEDASVKGTFTPRHRPDEATGERAVAGESVEGYYPPIIDPAQFARVQEGIQTRKKRSKGPRGKDCTNLFSGLLKDARDGQRFHVRRSRGEALITNIGAMNRNPGSIWIDFPYARLESALLGLCREISPAMLFRSPDGELAKREGELADCRAKIQRAQERLDKATDEAEEEVYTMRLVSLTRQRNELELAVDAARAAESTQPEDQLKQLQNMLATLENCPAEELSTRRFQISAVIQTIVKGIHVWLQRKGKRTRYQKRAWIFVEFCDGAWRKLYLSPDGVDVSQAYDHEQDVNFTVPAGHGWE